MGTCCGKNKQKKCPPGCVPIPQQVQCPPGCMPAQQQSYYQPQQVFQPQQQLPYCPPQQHYIQQQPQQQLPYCPPQQQYIPPPPPPQQQLPYCPPQQQYIPPPPPPPQPQIQFYQPPPPPPLPLPQPQIQYYQPPPQQPPYCPPCPPCPPFYPQQQPNFSPQHSFSQQQLPGQAIPQQIVVYRPSSNNGHRTTSNQQKPRVQCPPGCVPISPATSPAPRS